MLPLIDHQISLPVYYLVPDNYDEQLHWLLVPLHYLLEVHKHLADIFLKMSLYEILG